MHEKHTILGMNLKRKIWLMDFNPFIFILFYILLSESCWFLFWVDCTIYKIFIETVLCSWRYIIIIIMGNWILTKDSSFSQNCDCCHKTACLFAENDRASPGVWRALLWRRAAATAHASRRKKRTIPFNSMIHSWLCSGLVSLFVL